MFKVSPNVYFIGGHVPSDHSKGQYEVLKNAKARAVEEEMQTNKQANVETKTKLREKKCLANATQNLHYECFPINERETHQVQFLISYATLGLK